VVELSRRITSLPFSNAGRHSNCRSPQLAGQSVNFIARECW
jgi:hypothetical protein